MLEILRGYKEAFLNAQVVSVLMDHLADCLQAPAKTQKHDQMVELIVVIFKQLLQIPDPKESESNTSFKGKQLHKNLILTFSRESVLDSFNFLSQEFKTPLQKKLCLHILDI